MWSTAPTHRWIRRAGSSPQQSRALVGADARNARRENDAVAAIAIADDRSTSQGRCPNRGRHRHAAADAPGLSTIQEIELLVKAGLSPQAALEAATTVAARHLGLEKEIGTLETGMSA